MLRKIKLENKPLCLVHHKDTIYFGDSRGNIFEAIYPFKTLKRIFNVNSPISSIVLFKNKLFYATWDGEVGEKNFKKKILLFNSIIKCMIDFKDHLLVSIDELIYILSLDLVVVDKIEVPHKVLCFSKNNNKVCAGMNVPFLGEIDEFFRFRIVKRTEHETAIMSMSQNLTGSSDGNIMSHNNSSYLSVFSSTGWIRSIFSIDLFSSGKKIIKKKQNNYEVLYEHEDDAMGVVEVKDKIISIGLDYTICIWEEFFLLEDELREIEELNRINE